MKTTNPWKITTLGLVVAGAAVVAGPEAVAQANDSLRDLIAGLEVKTDQIRSRTDNLPADPASQGQIDARFATVSADTAAIRTDTATLLTDTATVQMDLLALREGNDVLRQAAGSLQDGVNALRGDAGRLRSDSAAFDAKLEAILSSLDDLHTELDAVSAQVSKVPMLESVGTLAIVQGKHAALVDAGRGRGDDVTASFIDTRTRWNWAGQTSDFVCNDGAASYLFQRSLGGNIQRAEVVVHFPGALNISTLPATLTTENVELGVQRVTRQLVPGAKVLGVLVEDRTTATSRTTVVTQVLGDRCP